MLDRIDLRILERLQADASSSVAQLAEAVGVSKSACWRRVQKLEQQQVILDRVTLLNQDSVNLPLTVYISVRTNQHTSDWADRFKELISDIPEVLEIHRMSGDLDYLIKAVVTDMPGYDRLYKKIIMAELSDVSSSFVMETMKHTTKLPLRHVQDN